MNTYVVEYYNTYGLMKSATVEAKNMESAVDRAVLIDPEYIKTITVWKI